MFASFRRHQKWIWTLAIIVVIPSFVIFFTNTQNLTAVNANKPIPGASVNNQPVLQGELRDAQREALVLYRLNTGRWPEAESAELEGFAYTYLARVRKTQDAGIVISDDMVVQRIKNFFRDEKGYNPEYYKNFINGDLAKYNLNEDDVFRYFKHDLAFSQLQSVYGMTGRLVTARAVEPLFRHDHEQAVVELVFLQASNFVSKVTVKADELGQFYTNRQANYFVPPRVSLAYVEYPASNYFALADQAIAKIAQFDSQVENFYQQAITTRGTNAFLGPDGNGLTPEAAKQKIKDDNRKQLALNEARRDAIKLAEKALDKEPRRVENLISAAEAMKLTVKTTEPFDEEKGPAGIKLPPAFIEVAFRLTTDEAIAASPVIGEDAVYVVAIKQQFPRETLPMDKVRDKVTEDYKEFQSQLLMRTAGNTLQTNLSKAITAGKSFKDACAEQKVTPVELPPFSRADRSVKGHEDLAGFSRISNDAFTVKPGKVSNFAFMGDQGYILHVREHLPVSEELVKTELPKFVEQARDRSMNIAFSDWINKHLQVARPEPKKEKQP